MFEKEMKQMPDVCIESVSESGGLEEYKASDSE